MIKNVLLLGNITLREKCSVIDNFQCDILKEEITDLKDTLENFRQINGFGRGIAAPQIGITKRIIALNLGKATFVIINPKITFRSHETFSLWDDCMSFPDLMVKVIRSQTINIDYQDGSGNVKKWDNIGLAESELLQHEIDHLDGVLAVDRISKGKDIIYKSEFNKNKELYEKQVDYIIKPVL